MVDMEKLTGVSFIMEGEIEKTMDFMEAFGGLEYFVRNRNDHEKDNVWKVGYAGTTKVGEGIWLQFLTVAKKFGAKYHFDVQYKYEFDSEKETIDATWHNIPPTNTHSGCRPVDWRCYLNQELGFSVKKGKKDPS